MNKSNEKLKEVVMIMSPNGYLFYRTAGERRSDAWRGFFGNNHSPYVLPLEDAIKAYEAIGYSAVKYELVNPMRDYTEWNSDLCYHETKWKKIYDNEEEYITTTIFELKCGCKLERRANARNELVQCYDHEEGAMYRPSESMTSIELNMLLKELEVLPYSYEMRIRAIDDEEDYKY